MKGLTGSFLSFDIGVLSSLNFKPAVFVVTVFVVVDFEDVIFCVATVVFESNFL
jgi:hypothetical protein